MSVQLRPEAAARIVGPTVEQIVLEPELITGGEAFAFTDSIELS